MFGFQNAESDYEVASAEGSPFMHDGTDELAYECPYPGCAHSFKYKCNLNVHQRKKHGGIYGSDQMVTFFCRVPNCGRTFFSRGALAKHQNYIHGIQSGERSWLADRDYVFARQFGQKNL